MASFSALFEKLSNAWAKRRAQAALSAQVERGDAILNPSPEIRLLLELPGDFIPDDARELARDLFGLLLFLEMTPTRDGRDTATKDSFALLTRVREQAWAGYFHPNALVRRIEANHPRSDVARRFVLYCNELVEKRSTYLFLPIVAAVDRHQATPVRAADDLYRMLEASTARQDDGAHTALARASFALVPEAKEHTAFAFASMLVGSRSIAGEYKEHLKAVAEWLRRIAKAVSGEPIDGVSDDSASVIEVANDHGSWIWLEALVVVENWISGPQWFDNAFEVEIGRISF